MRKAFATFPDDTDDQEAESLEEKRKKIVDFCESAFKPECVEEMKRKFAPLVARWNEETVEAWFRWGIDEHIGERIFLAIEGIDKYPMAGEAS